MCCTRLAANAGPKKVAKNRHLGTIAQLCQAISSQLRHVLTIGKNLLNSNISSTFPHNMVNFGPLAAEIVSLVWGTPTKFQRVLRLGSVTARHLVLSSSSSSFFSSPNLSGRRLDVYHTLAHGVALVRI